MRCTRLDMLDRRSRTKKKGQRRRCLGRGARCTGTRDSARCGCSLVQSRAYGMRTLTLKSNYHMLLSVGGTVLLRVRHLMMLVGNFVVASFVWLGLVGLGCGMLYAMLAMVSVLVRCGVRRVDSNPGSNHPPSAYRTKSYHTCVHNPQQNVPFFRYTNSTIDRAVSILLLVLYCHTSYESYNAVSIVVKSLVQVLLTVVKVKAVYDFAHLCLRGSPPSHMISHSSPRRSSSRDGSSTLGMSFGHDFRSFSKLASSSIGVELVTPAPPTGVPATGVLLLLFVVALVVLGLDLFALREEDMDGRALSEAL